MSRRRCYPASCPLTLTALAEYDRKKLLKAFKEVSSVGYRSVRYGGTNNFS